MSSPKEPTEEQKKKDAAAQKKTEADIAEALAAAARARNAVLQPPPITPVVDLDEDKPAVQEGYYPSPRISEKDKDKKKGQDLKDEPIWAVCKMGTPLECSAFNMTYDEAKEYCDKANELLSSEKPEDRAKAEESWILFKNGKRDEAIKMLDQELGTGKKLNPAETCQDYRSKMDNFKATPRLKPLPGDATTNPEDIEEERRKRGLGETPPG